MPVGTLKNRLYGAALPVLGKRCEWSRVHCDASDTRIAKELRHILQKRHAVGAVIQVIRGGKLAECYVAGNARLVPSPVPVRKDTVFRTASVAKMVTALLVFRLQTLGLLSVDEDVSDSLGYAVRNPQHPDKPITLSMLLSHTSSILDSPAYFTAFSTSAKLQDLLEGAAAFSTNAPGTRFRYSNLAAGMIGCLLEARFARSLESLAQEHLFAPLNVEATFDTAMLDAPRVADCYRVLPFRREPAFHAARRLDAASPLSAPDPQRHYFLASGNLFVTGESMAKLLLPCIPKEGGEASFLDENSLLQMKTPLGQWPEDAVSMGYGMGLLALKDPAVSTRVCYGHQGFAYGAVNGCFFAEDGSGFVSLNSGASEERLGHLSLLNRDLIRLFLG